MPRRTLRTHTIIAAQRAYSRKGAYVLAFVLTFSLTFSLLLAADFVPNAVSMSPDVETVKDEPEVALSSSPLVEAPSVRPLLSADVGDAGVLQRLQGEYPTSISIPAIGLKAHIDNPQSTDIAVLDEALLDSAVRYPTSAKLGVQGNVVLFAHSSYLPVVHNPAFKAFNGIQKLKAGDTITVEGEHKAYIYEVEEVGEADASADAIPLTVSGTILTLSTCDSFGFKTDRFIVIARLVETRPL